MIGLSQQSEMLFSEKKKPCYSLTFPKIKCYIREHHMFKLQPTDQDLLILSSIEIGGKRFHT